MFDAVRNNQKIVQVFLALITLPFAFFGIEAYVRNSGAGDDVARVGDTKITAHEFELAMRERQDQLRRSMGESFRPEMLNSLDARMSVLNSLIDRRLLLLDSSQNRMVVSNAALVNEINRIPALQDNGKFSLERYNRLLNAQGMSKPQFEAMYRQDLTIQQLMDAVSETAFVSQAQADALLDIQLGGRQYAEHHIAPGQFTAQVKLAADAAEKYYNDNKAEFETPEQVKAEFVVLSPDALAAQAAISEAEVKAAYEAGKDRYQQAEERRASHILITAKNDGEKAAARKKAEELLKEVRKTPAKFADLAKQHSQDPGSAGNGGDLGYFGRDAMVKPFEDATFSLKNGEISDVVESDFGYHIIKLTGIKPAKLLPLESVRADIEKDLRQQAALQKFAESAESFSNMVYEQPDSLQAAAEGFKLQPQQSGWIARNAMPQEAAALGLLGNEKVRAALFSDDAIKNKRNIEAVEVAPNTLLAARVIEHKAAALKPFESVKGEIEKLLIAREAGRLAEESGKAHLAALQKGEADKVSWSSLKTATRMQRGDLPAEAVRPLFQAETEKLPAYVGVNVRGGYSLYKLVKLVPPEKLDETRRKALERQYAGILAQEDLSAYINALRARYKIDINKSLLESREH